MSLTLSSSGRVIITTMLFFFSYRAVVGQGHTNVLFGDEKEEATKLLIRKCVSMEAGFDMVTSPHGSSKINPGGSGNYSYCIKFGKHTGFGGGSAVMVFDQQVYLPLYLKSMVMLSERKHSPFISLEGGYSLGWSNRYKTYQKYRSDGGVYLSGELGWRFRIDNQFSFYSGISYRRQNSSFYYEMSQQTIHKTARYNILVINLGLMLEQH